MKRTGVAYTAPMIVAAPRRRWRTPAWRRTVSFLAHLAGAWLGAASGQAFAQQDEVHTQVHETTPALEQDTNQIERNIVEPALLGLSLLDRHGTPGDVVTAFEHFPQDVQEDSRALLIYVRALSALNRGEDARDALRAGLALHPDNARLRAELARSLFEGHHEGAARVQFELALAAQGDGGLSEAERGAVRQYLSAIDQQRTWRWRASFALAPDSNIHAATSAEEVELFGLPFELDEDSRRTSGVGVQYGLGVTARFGQLGAQPGFWLVDADINRIDHEGASFDQTHLGMSIGARLQANPTLQLGLDALGEKRWRAGTDYSHAYGLAANLFARIGEQIIVNAATAIRESDEAIGRRRDGRLLSLDAAVSRRSAPDRILEGRLYMQRGDLEAREESFWFGYVSAGVYREFSGGVGLYAEPYVSYRRNDATDPLFAIQRIDREYGVQVRASKRDWTIFDAAPYVSALISTRSSTHPLYDDADRVRAEFGFTRTF